MADCTRWWKQPQIARKWEESGDHNLCPSPWSQFVSTLGGGGGCKSQLSGGGSVCLTRLYNRPWAIYTSYYRRFKTGILPYTSHKINKIVTGQFKSNHCLLQYYHVFCKYVCVKVKKIYIFTTIYASYTRSLNINILARPSVFCTNKLKITDYGIFKYIQLKVFS